MHLTLPPHISACRIAGRSLILDLRTNRYLALPPDLDTSFQAVFDGLTPSERDAERLCLLGLTVRRKTETPPRLTTYPAPRADLDLAGVTPTLSSVLDAIASQVRATHALKRRGLEAAILRLHQVKRARNPKGGHRVLCEFAASAQLSGRFIDRHNRCLENSLAFTTRCRRQGLAADLILGVKMGPFAAHAWVQSGETVLNDRLDQVRHFTPILVV
ncbi:lasso peptide biosynthesis B2 protein [Asticcacaulis sp. YBE204]|uniref:lasso peptide biosynthesis B2 protein n=1 Tax=Asticcacaulis sp. YBE204 TaxID=1282363 RepID=UPI0003C3CBB9|nr:lasso peptide biosynthesis B2 protein [Asticcacaulis sp. YBE204]ESQ79308.1 hypothetical protein AEYBE204_09875 [Asticcacaulis sp. YBE204]